MKELVKLSSVICVFTGFLLMYSLQPSADDNLDHSGKIRLQTDRIGQDAAEREKLTTQDYQETELEKMAPDLFKEENQAALKTKQIEIKQSTSELEQGLFLGPSKPNSTLKSAEKVLFSNSYTVHKTTAPTQNMPENNPDGPFGTKTLTAFLGIVIAGCGGIFTMIRKTLE